MKLSCTKDNLFQGLAATSHVTNKNVHLPILSNVLVKADGKTIKLTSTNLEMAVICSVRGKIDEEGEFTVPSKLFFDYVNLLPNERVDMEVVDESLAVECEQNKTKIKGMSATEFPLVPPVAGDQIYQASVSEFRQALSQVLFSVATNESRPELSGVVFKFHDETAGKNTLTLAATDSYRLAERTIVLDQGSETTPRDVIVPSRTLSELTRILGIFKDDVDAPERLEIRLSEAQIVFKSGPVELISRTIEGSYPDYRQIIPKEFKTDATVAKDELIKAVKTAALFSRTGLFDVTLAFDASGKIVVTANDSNRGENKAECGAKVEGDANTITVNFRYLLDGLNAMNTEEVSVGVNDGASPCLIRPKGDNAGQYLYLVMPIKQ